MSRKIIFLIITLLLIFGCYKLWRSQSIPQSLDINIVSTSGLPITSTFVYGDMGLDANNYKDLVKEFKSTGIDTIIVHLGDVDKDCLNASSPYVDNYYLTQSNRAEGMFIQEALAANLKIIFGFRSPYFKGCINPTNGTPTDVNTTMGHLIAHSLTAADSLKTFLASKGISWTDPRIAGFYIPEEIDIFYLGDPESKRITFYKELSSRLVPYGKPIMFSPFLSDQADYNRTLQAFKNIISMTNITILAPTDSLGTAVTTSFARDQDHYRALADAKAAYPDKNVEVWANIELFQAIAKDPTYTPEIAGKPVDWIPAPFSRVQQQIEAARPYVSKMTSWIYQQNMMVLPAVNNLSSILTWNNMYTPVLATRRAQLRADYLAAYGGTSVAAPPITPSTTCNQLYYYNKTTKLCAATADTYNSSQINCNNSSNTCTQNINLYLPGATTGICYTSSALCQNANSLTTTLTPTPTPTTTPTTSPSFKSSDLNTDTKVNLYDANIFIANYGTIGSPGFTRADINKDGKVDLVDYKILVSEYGK